MQITYKNTFVRSQRRKVDGELIFVTVSGKIGDRSLKLRDVVTEKRYFRRRFLSSAF